MPLSFLFELFVWIYFAKRHDLFLQISAASPDLPMESAGCIVAPRRLYFGKPTSRNRATFRRRHSRACVLPTAVMKAGVLLLKATLRRACAFRSWSASRSARRPPPHPAESLSRFSSRSSAPTWACPDSTSASKTCRWPPAAAAALFGFGAHRFGKPVAPPDEEALANVPRLPLTTGAKERWSQKIPTFTRLPPSPLQKWEPT